MLPKVDYVLITPLFWCNFYMDFRLLWGISAAFEAEVRVQNHLAADGSFFVR